MTLGWKIKHSEKEAIKVFLFVNEKFVVILIAQKINV